MDELAPLLHAFYTQPLTPADRAIIHEKLLQSLTHSPYQKAAIDYLRSIAEHPTPINAVVVHHALQIVDSLVRTSFDRLSTDDRLSLYYTLAAFLQSAHKRYLIDVPESARVPPHALNKAAAVHITLLKRLWLTAQIDAPRILLAMLESPAHTLETLDKLLVGTMVVTMLLDDIVSPRKDLRASDAVRLRSLVAQDAATFVPGLEVALRAAGPLLPKHISPSAARALAMLPKIEPRLASECAAVLARSTETRFDEVAATFLTNIADVLATPAVIELHPVLTTTVAALEALALNRVVPAQFAASLLAVVDAVVTRLVARPSSAPPDTLQRLLNALMGATMCWARGTPHWLPRVLDCWITILEKFDDADLRDTEILQHVYPAVSKLCLGQCFVASNATTLQSLRRARDAPLPAGAALVAWDLAAETMAEVAISPHGLAVPSLFFDYGATENEIGGKNGQLIHDDADTEVDEDDDDDDEGWEGCSRASFTGKCVETLTVITQMSSQPLVIETTELVIKSIRDNMNAAMADVNGEASDDILTSATLAYSLTATLPATLSTTHHLLDVVREALNSGVWRRARLGIILLRTAARLVPILGAVGTNMELQAADKAVALNSIARAVIEAPACPQRLATAAALLVVALDAAYRDALFSSRPPIEIETLATTQYRGVAGLGVAVLARWSVVPTKRGQRTRPAWSDDEWRGRQAAFQSGCAVVFADLAKAGDAGVEALLSQAGLVSVARGCGLLRSLLHGVFGVQGHTADAVWAAVGKSASVQLHAVAKAVAGAMATGRGVDDDIRRAAGVVLAGVVNTVGSLLSTCGRHAEREAPGLVGEVVKAVLPLAQDDTSLRLARSVMTLVRDRLAAGDGALLLPGIDLAARAVDSRADQDVCEVAVSLLTEALKRHWRTFWPGDVAAVDSGQAAGEKMAAPQADEATGRAYGVAVHGLLAALRSVDLAVCRASLLALQQLDASRKLFSRDEAFRAAGLAQAVAVEAVRILGGGGDFGRESLGDEAVGVLWGLARVDIPMFQSALPVIIREVCPAGGDVMQELMRMFAVADQHSFARAVRALVSDLAFYGRSSSL